jgi:hypothetical protein
VNREGRASNLCEYAGSLPTSFFYWILSMWKIFVLEMT